MPNALGLMSGTSLDGVDAALLVTDGADQFEPGPTETFAYDDDQRRLLRDALDTARAWDHRARRPPELIDAERLVTAAHIAAVQRFIERHGTRPDLIGLHGQTLIHRPADAFTLQVGDAQALADASGVPVVADFRLADLAAGGQGAPLAPLFHEMLARRAGLDHAAIVNIGGIANVTFVGDDTPLAFDTGPGNALLDDWAARHTGRPLDLDGALAARGEIVPEALAALLDNPYYDRPPPKSLDRLDFSAACLADLAPADGAATLTALTAGTIAASAGLVGRAPRRWILTGGGRRNPTLVAMLAARVAPDEVRTAEDLGWDGDALEAQLFGWLAVRSTRDLPLTLPGTTGVGRPTRGGNLYAPRG